MNGVAARFDADVLQGGLTAVVLPGHREGEDLRDRVQREGVVGAAAVELGAVDVGQRDAEAVGLGPHLGRVVARDLVVAEVQGVELFQLLSEEGGVGCGHGETSSLGLLVTLRIDGRWGRRLPPTPDPTAATGEAMPAARWANGGRSRVRPDSI
ncbi:hypothetical protein BH20ACT3_BH20ACT3_07570 [soil metagenome]